MPVMYRGKPWEGTFDRVAEAEDEEKRRKVAELIAAKAELRTGAGDRPEDLGAAGGRIMAAGERAAIPRGTVTLPGMGPTSVDQALANLDNPQMLAATREKPPEFYPPDSPTFLSAKGVPVADMSQMEKPDFSDRNGNGIPDGAEITRTVTHEGPDGEQIKDTMSWVKRQRRDMGIDLAVTDQNNPFQNQAMTAEEALGARRDQLAKKAGNAELSGADRRTAATELAEVREELAGRAKAKEYAEAVQTVTNREREKADKQLQGQLARAAATEKAATIAGQSKLGVADIKATSELAKEERRKERELAVTGLLNEGHLAEANTRALADKTVAEINADADRVVAELNRQGRTEEARIVADSRFQMDASTYLILSKDLDTEQRKGLLERILKTAPTTAQGTSPGTPPPAGKKPVAQRRLANGKIEYRAADGSTWTS